MISKGAYPFSSQELHLAIALPKQPVTATNSVDYSDESFEEYDSEASDDNHGSAFQDRKKNMKIKMSK